MNRRKKKRIKWSTVGERVGDKQFWRMFRMTRKCFAELCTNIATSVELIFQRPNRPNEKNHIKLCIKASLHLLVYIRLHAQYLLKCEKISSI